MGKRIISDLPEGFEIEQSDSGFANLPAGFVIDQQDETVPDLPAGFELDTPTPMAERLGKGFGMGVAGSVEGFGGGLEFMGEQIPQELAPVAKLAMKFAGKQLSNLGKSRKEFYKIKDPDLAYNIASGAGSMGTFLIPGLGAGKLVQAARLAPKIAVAVASGVSGALEAMTEGGSAYHRALDKGFDEKGAIAAGNATFALNVPTTILLNRIGIFGDAAKEVTRGLKRVAATGKVLGMAALSEGTQEAIQQVISNTAVSDDPSEGVFESALIGAITGGGVKTIATISDATAPKTDQPRTVDLTQPETIQAPPPSPEILAEVAKSEPMFNVEPGVPNVTPALPEGFQLDQPQENSIPFVKNKTVYVDGVATNKTTTQAAYEFGTKNLGNQELRQQIVEAKKLNSSKMMELLETPAEQMTPEIEMQQSDMASQGHFLGEVIMAIDGKLDLAGGGVGGVGKGTGGVNGIKAKFERAALTSAKKKQATLEYLTKFENELFSKKSSPEQMAKIRKRMEKYKLTPEEEQALANEGSQSLPEGFEIDQDSVPPGAQESNTAFADTATPGEASVNIKPIESIELVGLATDLMKGNVPINKNLPTSHGYFMPRGDGTIALNNNLFNRGQEQQLAKTLAHEIGHLIDYLPERMMNRGDLYNRLMVLKDHVKNSFADLANQDLRTELYALSKEWRPYNEATASESHKKYRHSSVEIYADFISALFNDPNYTKTKAPKAFDLFFQTFNRKPEVFLAYNAIQDILRGDPLAIVEQRQRNIRKEFLEGKKRRDELLKNKINDKIDLWTRLQMMFVSRITPLKQKFSSKEESILPKQGSPVYAFEELSFIDNDNTLMVMKIQQDVLAPLTKAKLSEEDLGEYLKLKRIEGVPGLPKQSDFDKYEGALDPEELKAAKELAKKLADRQDIANPLGFNPASATRQLEYLRQQVGEEAWKALESSAQKFHDIVFDILVEAQRVGSYSKKNFNEIVVPNRNHYVTFGVLKYLQEHVPATIKMQKGTLLEIENPFVTTILKMISLNRLNARQDAFNQLRDALKRDFPDEISLGKENRSGGFIKPAPGSKKGLITFLEDGKMVSYEVDAYIADSVNNAKIGDVQLLGHLINKFFHNNFFKNLYITYNPGFAFGMNPLRDLKRNYANLNALGAKASIADIIIEYWNKLPSAYKYARGIIDPTTSEMLKNKAFATPFVDFNYDLQNDSYHAILDKLKLLKGEEHIYMKMVKPILRPLLWVMDKIRIYGSTLENLGKISGYSILKKSGKFNQKQLAHFTRKYISTPNFREGGTLTPATNSIWMFSNIKIQGLVSDGKLATHPTTRSGFMWSHFKVNILPKLMMFMAAAGWFGKELKEAFDKQTEYDKTNYITVPLPGEDENGKVIYFRIPHDESGRLMAAIMWKALNAMEKGEPKQLQQILAIGAGELPGVAPGINIIQKWIDYMSGKNPYDAFRGRNLISDTEFKAGGLASTKKMIKWTVNNSGMVQFATYDNSKESGTEKWLTYTPIFNRLFKVSDYGIKESFKDDRANIEQKNAQRTLKKRELVDKGIDRIKKGESQNTVANDIAKQLYEKPTGEQRRAIMTELKQEEVKGKNIYIDTLLSATTNEEKILIMREMRQRFDAKTMRQLEIQILKSRAASPLVIRQSRK